MIASFKRLYRLKLKIFFANCESKDYKNSKKLWKFYSSITKIKSSNKNCSIPLKLSDGNITADTPLLPTYLTPISVKLHQIPLQILTIASTILMTVFLN